MVVFRPSLTNYNTILNRAWPLPKLLPRLQSFENLTVNQVLHNCCIVNGHYCCVVYRHCLRNSVVSCEGLVGNVSWMLFQEGRSPNFSYDGELGRPHTGAIIPASSALEFNVHKQ